MMHPFVNAPLPPEWYWQPEHLDLEREKIFSENWIFAGFAEDVARDNDYIAFSICGLPVVLRNMKGKLVAFRNVCSHRHSLIHAYGQGNAAFRCLYHGWTYNAEGVPIGVPDNERSFGFTKEDKCSLALQSFAVEQCGRFIFVRIAKAGPALKEWLGAFYFSLEHISTLFDKIYSRVEQSWSCNWKMGLEITVEGYHLPVVHPKSFSEHIGGIDEQLEKTPDANPPMMKVDANTFGHTEYVGPHSTNVSALAGSSVEHLSAVAKRLQLPVSDRMRGYDHFLIYPNVMVGINGGTNVCVERYEPISAGETRVECWLMTGTPKDKKLYNGIIWQTITKQWTDWTVSVLAEDQYACESVQKAVRFAPRRALLGNAEERVRHYQSALRDNIMQTEKAA